MKQKVRVADYIADFVYRQGTRCVFMLSGGGIMHLTDGLACHKNLEVYCLHHEQAVSMAQEAYARLTGEWGVGYYTTGPGATNALTGLAGAWLDSVATLFISGQVKRKEAIHYLGLKGTRQIGVQEINILPIVSSLTKYSAFVDKPEDILFHLQKALYMSRQGRPGPAWLDIPLDVQGALIDVASLKGYKAPVSRKIFDRDDQEYILKLLKKSVRPVILAGQGIRLGGARESLLRFAHRYKIPVVTTFLGVDLIDSQDPCYVGRIGIKGDRAGNLAMQNADTLLIIGTSLPVAEIGYEYEHFARRAKIVVVDIDPGSHEKDAIRIDRLIIQNACDFFNRLLDLGAKERLLSRMDTEWVKRCICWRDRYPVCLPEYKKLPSRINIYYFIDRLSDYLMKSDVVITDAGSAFYAGSQGIKIKKGMRYITSGGFATMGYSLPASIGACVGNRRKRIICITGDGSFQQNIQELQTAIHYRLPVKIFVLNNEGYLSIRFTQKKYFEKRLIGEGKSSGVSFPDTSKIAKAYGISYYRASVNKELDRAIENTLKNNGPVICEIMTPPEQQIIPTVASRRREDGSMVSKPLEDMYPFLSRREFLNNMVIDPVKD